MTAIRINPSSLVETQEIGEGTRIWHYTHVMPRVRIGKRVVIGQCCFIGNDCEIGDGSKIQNSVNIFETAIIGKEVFIGPGVTFCNVMRPRAFIEQKNNFMTTVVREGATIGAGATILPGIIIGEYAFVAAGSVVTKDVPPFAMVAGNPAVLKGWVDRIGYPVSYNEMMELSAPEGEL